MLERFVDLWQRLEGKEDPFRLYGTLDELYSQPHRHYHNWNHIDHCLTELEDAPVAKDHDQIEFDIWLHDSIYLTLGKDNEKKSAELATDICIRNCFSDSFTRKSYDMILATRHDKEPKDEDTKLLLDIDLSILGQPYDMFKRYEKNIRKENWWIPEPFYRKKRKKFMVRFLERDRIYHTEYFREIYEARARKNIKSLL